MKKLLLIIPALICLSANAQWIAKNTLNATSRGVGKIKVVDKNTVWAVVYDGTAANTNIQEVMKTANGGNSFRLLKLATTNMGAYKITNITSFDSTTAWAGVFPMGTPTTSNNKQGVYKTVNGGTTWTKVSGTSFRTTAFFDGVHFFDANNGVAFGDPVSNIWDIYTTTDGGTVWTKVPTANMPAPLAGEYAYVGNFDFNGNTIWVNTNMGTVLKSTDKGYNWTVASTPLTDIQDINFINATTGFIRQQDTSGLNLLGLTLDGGTTWNLVNHTGPLYNAGLDYVPANPGFLLSTGSAQYIKGTTQSGSGTSYSLDTGKTWIGIDSAEQRLDLAVYSDSIIWCGGFSGGPGTPGINYWDPTYTAAPVGIMNTCLNPATGTYTTGGSPYATSYSWTLSPSNAGVLTPNGRTATINWDNAYSGYAEINVTGINGAIMNPFPQVPFGVNVFDLPTVFANASATLICTGSSVNLFGTGATTYTWDNGVSNNVPFSPTATAPYTVIGTDDNGCTNSSSITITVDLCSGIEKVASQKGLLISPNPSKGIFNITSSNKLGAIEVYDFSGKLLNAQNVDKNFVTIDLENLPTGLYFLKVENKAYKLTKE